MPYATLDDVLAEAGVLTVAQQARALTLLDAASNWVDTYTGRTWGPATVTDEHHVLNGRGTRWGWSWRYYEDLFLGRAPVATVTSVYTEPAGAGLELTVTVVDARLAWLRIPGGWLGEDVFVTYTTTDAVPVEVSVATAKLAASWLAREVEQSYPQGIKSLGIGQGELTMTFQDSTALAKLAAPPAVEQVLRGLRRALPFA